MARFPGISLLVTCALALAVAPAAAQGGWRQWDIVLIDGKRVEANPLGSPDDEHVAVSVGALEGSEAAIARSRIDYIAAQTTVGPNREPLPYVKLPPPPVGPACADVIVHLDGRRTTGRVTLKHIAYSEGTVTQGGKDIDLQAIAYIKFAHDQASCAQPNWLPRDPFPRSSW